MAKPKRQHTNHTLKEKIEILNKLDCGVKAIDLCRQFNFKSVYNIYMEEAKEQVERHGR